MRGPIAYPFVGGYFHPKWMTFGALETVIPHSHADEERERERLCRYSIRPESPRVSQQVVMRTGQ